MLLIIKISVTVCLLVLGWIPGIIPVAAPEIEVQVQGKEETESQFDAKWIQDYRVHAMEAFIAGALMTIVSRMSHILCKPGVLVHESYMSLYSYLITTITMPLLIFSSWTRREARDKHFLEDVTLEEKVIYFSILFALTMVKVFKMERGIMKRFVEDYDPEVHNFSLSWPWCRKI